ncbi:hypothetical protein [Rhodoferax sp.]|uniref:hypothetical protein n=1 Tax=Rhodoferax sp. TaxID=50421 RepID=UPI00374CA786
MSTLAPVRAAIKAKLAGVPQIGHVHDYERFVREEGKFRSLFEFDLVNGSKQLRGWWLRRTRTQELAIAMYRSVDVHTWQIRGYMALNDEDASELAFDELIEAFRDAVRADPTFGGICEPDPGEQGGQAAVQLVEVVDVGPVRFCGVLCHSAVLQLRTWSYI